jgi:L-alanine-DL-glutamate epimerase-like enolase superfamily enzyme
VVEPAFTPKVDRLEVSAYTVPTETPESDGTFAWTETTLVLVQVASCGVVGLRYSFADVATANLIDAHLRPGIVGYNPLNIPELWSSMVRTIRNLGRPGICSMAIAAVDNALWDLKARLLHLCVADLLGRAYPSIPAYGSGGFTSYSNSELKRQLTGWIDDGLTTVKMKIGTDPISDVARVRSARDARMLEANAVDVLQADATRCAGITGFLAAGNLSASFSTPFSARTAPSLHAHAACALHCAINVEYFFDHYRIEQMFFDGALVPSGGMLCPDSTRPGFGLECRLPDLEKYRVYGNSVA